jgi:hypothetical protein
MESRKGIVDIKDIVKISEIEQILHMSNIILERKENQYKRKFNENFKNIK